MKISTKQAGAILKVDPSSICNLVKAGKLKDYGNVNNGGKKHVLVLDSREVRAFKKVYKKHNHYKNILVNPAESPNRVYRPVISTLSNGVMTRLGNIETKLNILNSKVDKLIEMWS